MFNRWILGGVALLILFAVACVLWYQHDTADERRAAAKAEELLRQSEIQKSDIRSEAEQADDQTSVESTAQSQSIGKASDQDKIPSKTTLRESLIDMNKSKSVNVNIDGRDIMIDTSIHPYMEESPFGFGPYPKIPEG